MQGILLVDKPVGWTSFDVVNYIRRKVASIEGKKPKTIKVGHSGTLDPFASGLLIILVGKDYTRRAIGFSKLDKTYEATVRLGKVSTTGDNEGQLTNISDTVPSLSDIEKNVRKMTGKISQTPPAYSAIKINGRRAYQLAREGKKVEIEPRNITVHSMTIEQYDYPNLKLQVDVSSGTYVRSLSEYLGKSLGTGAYTEELRRTQIGDYSINGASPVSIIDVGNLSSLFINE